MDSTASRLPLSSISGYPAITPRAPAFVIAAVQCSRKFSRNVRSDSSMAPRSKPLVGPLCAGKSVSSATVFPVQRRHILELRARWLRRFWNKDKDPRYRILRYDPSVAYTQGRFSWPSHPADQIIDAFFDGSFGIKICGCNATTPVPANQRNKFLAAISSQNR